MVPRYLPAGQGLQGATENPDDVERADGAVQEMQAGYTALL
jgi:hypothetical protein